MKNHKGFTIVELLIGMTILSIVAVALTGFIVSSSKSYAASNTEIMIQQESQLAMNQISDVIIDTTRSVNYVGYSLDESVSEQVEKDADFTIDVVNKSLVIYNGEVEYEVDENGEIKKDSDGKLIVATKEDGSLNIDEGNGNKNYQIYWDKREEKLYFTQIDISETDFSTGEKFVLAEYVKDFSVDLSQVEEKRVVKLSISYGYNNKVYETSNNITIRNKVLVNSVNLVVNKSIEIKVRVKEPYVVLEPGEDYYQFSTPIVEGRNILDKSVTWSIAPEEQSKLTGSDTGFLDTANGIIHISSAEKVKSFKVTVTTNAVDSQGNPDSETVTVKVKRANGVKLYKSDDSDTTNGQLEISPGCTFTISVASVEGNEIGVTCSKCGDDIAIDNDVVDGYWPKTFAWRIWKYEYDGLENPNSWDPEAYVSVVGQPDAHSATFYVDPNTPADGSVGITIQATSLLSITGNAYGRNYDPAFGAIGLVVKKQKKANISAGGSLHWGASTVITWDELSYFHYYVICARVREYGTEGGDKIMMYLSEGTTTRVTPDMFGVEDVSKPWYLSLQVLNPGKVIPPGVGLSVNVRSDVAAQVNDPTVLDLINDYLNNCDSSGTYVGTKYLHSDKLETTINPPEIYYAYNGKNNLGGELKLNTVSALGGGAWTEFSVDYVKNTRDETLGYWFANNNIKFSMYKENADGSLQKIYGYNANGNYYEGESNPYGGLLQLNEIQSASRVIIKLDSNNMGRISEAEGKYRLIPTIIYEQGSWADHVGGVSVYYVNYDPNYKNKQCYEDTRSTVYYELTSGGNLKDLWISSYDNFYKGEIYFPTPSDSEFRNYFALRNPAMQTFNAYNYFRMRDKDGNIRGLNFSRMTCRYISTEDAYEIELFYNCKDSLWNCQVEMSAGVYKCSANGKEWNKVIAGTLDVQLNNGIMEVKSNGNARIKVIGVGDSLEAYIPSPTSGEFLNSWHGCFGFDMDKMKVADGQTVTGLADNGVTIRYRKSSNSNVDYLPCKVATCEYNANTKTYTLKITYYNDWDKVDSKSTEMTFIWTEGNTKWEQEKK